MQTKDHIEDDIKKDTDRRIQYIKENFQPEQINLLLKTAQFVLFKRNLEAAYPKTRASPQIVSVSHSFEDDLKKHLASAQARSQPPPSYTFTKNRSKP